MKILGELVAGVVTVAVLTAVVAPIILDAFGGMT